MKHINSNFIFQLDKMAGELDNVSQPHRPSKEQKQSKYDKGGELTPIYKNKVKIGVLNNRYAGGMKWD